MRLTFMAWVLGVMTAGQAMAQDAGAPPAPNPLASMLPLLLVFAVMYFLMIRPQSKLRKQHMEMVQSLKRGDVVITAGGIRATVSRVEDKNLLLEIAPGVEVSVVRSTILEVEVRKGGAAKQPANDAAPAGTKKKKSK